MQLIIKYTKYSHLHSRHRHRWCTCAACFFCHKVFKTQRGMKAHQQHCKRLEEVLQDKRLRSFGNLKTRCLCCDEDGDGRILSFRGYEYHNPHQLSRDLIPCVGWQRKGHGRAFAQEKRSEGASVKSAFAHMRGCAVFMYYL